MPCFLLLARVFGIVHNKRFINFKNEEKPWHAMWKSQEGLDIEIKERTSTISTC
jgi:hypothetical protein